MNTITQDEDKVFLGPQIDFQVQESLFEAATKVAFFTRVMAMTLHREEAELRRILLDLGPDGLEAANLAADFIQSRDKLLGIADLMKTAAGRVYLILEQMEADREIVTTDAILEPLTKVVAGISANEAERVCKFAH